MDQPIEITTDHRCLLGALTDELAITARSGVTGRALADRARAALSSLDRERFCACCLPAYLALAPAEFDRELQLPIASADAARLDTRVLLWPIGAEDAQHPHRDGWAAFVVEDGVLAASDARRGVTEPERRLDLHAPEVLMPEEGVSHHIHNRGDIVGLTVHIFGV